jgi:predicted alpha/beta hydrolase family esterase
MAQQIFIIHGGNAFDSYENYLAALKSKEVTLDRLRSSDWKEGLGQRLGPEFEVFTPHMPNKQNAKYLEWKIYFEKLIPLMRSDVILVGHSLGGIFLAKYLSENAVNLSIKATFLIAAPFNRPDLRPLADFVLGADLALFAKQSGEIVCYHSKDDTIVPYASVECYAQALPQARIRSFDGRGHFNDPDLPELEDELKKHVTQKT